MYPAAAYLTVGDRLLSLTAKDVDRLPFGIQIPIKRHRDRPLLDLRAGIEATVGAGRLRLHGPGQTIEIQGGPLWDPRPSVAGLDWALSTVQERLDDLQRLLRHPADPAGGTQPAGLASSPFGSPVSRAVWERLRNGLRAVECAIRRADDRALAASAQSLVGLGPGLTPSGDDALGGLLAAGHFLARGLGADQRVWRRAGRIVCQAARGRTTFIGEALLSHAAVGQVSDTVGALLRALATRDPGPLQSALERTLAIGHTSGADTALGVLHGGRLALAMLAE